MIRFVFEINFVFNSESNCLTQCMYDVNVQFEGSNDDEETQIDDTITEINLNKTVNSMRASIFGRPVCNNFCFFLT